MMARARLLLAVHINRMPGLAGGLCRRGDDWREPEVHLVEVERSRPGCWSRSSHLRVDNPNDSRLFIRNLSYAIRSTTCCWCRTKPVSGAAWRHARRTFKINRAHQPCGSTQAIGQAAQSRQPLHYTLQGELVKLVIHRDLHLSRSGEIILAITSRSNPAMSQQPHVHGPDCNHDHGSQTTTTIMAMYTACTATTGHQEPVRNALKDVGRNDPFARGSEKKFKKCHGA